MGLYIKTSDVEIRLVGKVSFTDDAEDENRMSRTLLNRLISESEAMVEFELSPRYQMPFQTKDGLAFSKLPITSAASNIIRMLCEWKSVIRVLETDFGRGTVADADKYKEKLEKAYKDMIDEKLLKLKKDQAHGNWYYPPLPNLMLNYMNNQADDGFAGQVLVTSHNRGDYPAEQINNPAENFWTGHIDLISQDLNPSF